MIVEMGQTPHLFFPQPRIPKNLVSQDRCLGVRQRLLGLHVICIAFRLIVMGTSASVPKSGSIRGWEKFCLLRHTDLHLETEKSS